MLKDDFALPRPATMAGQIQGLMQAMGNEALARITLLINHVIASEPAATRRLAAQTGKIIRVQWRGWPTFLPASLTARLPLPVPACWVISAAGLLDFDPALAAAIDPVELGGLPVSVEIEGATAEPARADSGLVVTLDGGDIGRWLLAAAGGRPPMEIQGDAALAAEVGWLAVNLRWDIEDDLARIVGDAPAHQLARVMRWGVDAARRLAAGSASGLDSLRARATSSSDR